MEIGIATQRVNPASHMNKEADLPKKGIGFSKHLLGFVANQSSELKEVKAENAQSFLMNLEAILTTGKLEDLGLTQGQLDQLSKVKELDVNQIAAILGISTEGITTLFSELKSVMFGTGSHVDPDKVEDVYEDLLGILQLLQSALSQDIKGTKSSVENSLKELNSQGEIEGTVKLAKVMELFARNRDMHVTDASKAVELKDMVKNIKTGIEGILPKLEHSSGDWSKILREAYTRRLPEESLEKNPDMNASAAEKKGIQQVQGTNLHFVLPKAETFSMNLPQTSRSLQYEQFVKEFQNILGKSNMLSQPNMSKLLIKLYPEQLGSLRIELLQQNGVMTAKILASTTSAKEMLDSQIHGLKHAFSAQNLNVEKIEISQAFTDTERQYKGHSEQESHQHKQQQSDQAESTNEEEIQSFKDYLVNTEI
ncbi:flagellar hook-length control protein FliK [Rossellomorea sp. SC111]|uniref:flagellar hook-length control protein FliK n=1 Tax=Rossellomorea sp. SC111 TaxID=2968985 RepID=UPI00215A8F01|nr:flagellar hook-length control protein FliK [Rossellomorea sp. SC111]MCR8848646.1 flagellar hook-length control protein FliK [Rossellomorea sp. SC111]